jgi:hypothetical protein
VHEDTSYVANDFHDTASGEEEGVGVEAVGVYEGDVDEEGDAEDGKGCDIGRQITVVAIGRC